MPKAFQDACSSTTQPQSKSWKASPSKGTKKKGAAGVGSGALAGGKKKRRRKKLPKHILAAICALLVPYGGLSALVPGALAAPPVKSQILCAPRGPVIQKVGDRTIIGQLEFTQGFADVWFRKRHYNMRSRQKARLCLEYLVMQRAFCRRRARDLKTEIDAYILLQSGRQASAAIKLPHYFNSRPGKGDISPLRKELIFQDGVSGRYYLQVD